MVNSAINNKVTIIDTNIVVKFYLPKALFNNLIVNLDSNLMNARNLAQFYAQLLQVT